MIIDFDLNKPSISTIKDGDYFTVSFCSQNKKYNAFKTVFGKYQIDDIWNGVDLIYEKKSNNLKEFIYVNNIDSLHSFKFKINSNLKYKKIGDNIIFSKNNINIFCLSKPYIYKINKGFIKPDSVSIKFSESTGIYEVRLQKYEEECYPIIIDPTVETL